jgi:16S rRNA (cytidine1402-2'-O)-methyltransferase
MYRIEKLVFELVTYFPNRYISICRELTKKFEEIWRGYPNKIMEDLTSQTIKGEFVVIIAPDKFKIEQ